LDQRRFNSGNKAAKEAQEIWTCVVDYYKIPMPRINEATYTNLNIVERLRQIGWREVDIVFEMIYYVKNDIPQKERGQGKPHSGKSP
jgi:hypothetical protein